MTGTCQPVRGNSPLTPGHVVMVTTREPLSITGEVGFMCELWKLNERTTVSFYKLLRFHLQGY